MEVTVQGPNAHRMNAESVEVFTPFMGMSPEDFKKLSSSVLIAIPCRTGEGSGIHLSNNFGMWGLCGTKVAQFNEGHDGFIELTRQGIVKCFLEMCQNNEGLEYLVMIDNDERVHWDVPYRLAQWGKDIVTGVVCSFNTTKGGTFTCFVTKDKHGVGRFATVSRTKKLPMQGLREIEACGTGLLCVHKRVFERLASLGEYPFEIPQALRRQAMATGSLAQGEDMAFCAKAKAAGFKLYVDFSAHAGHYKMIEIRWPDQGRDSSISAAEWEVSPDDYVHT